MMSHTDFLAARLLSFLYLCECSGKYRCSCSWFVLALLQSSLTWCIVRCRCLQWQYCC